MSAKLDLRIAASPQPRRGPGRPALDALLSAVAAAWAWGKREENFGAPVPVDALEGWIAAPSLGAE